MMERGRDKAKAASDDDDEGPAREEQTLLSIKLRKGLALGKKARPCTPSPVWKLVEDSGEEFERVAGVVSARKLGANLWEVQDLLPEVGMNRKSGRTQRRDSDDLLAFGSVDRPRSGGSLRRRVVASLIQQRNSNEIRNHCLQTSPASYSSSMEVTSFKPAISPSGRKGRIGEPGYSLKTSTELLKVLNRIWSLEEQQASNVSVVKALKLELESARGRIHELMQEQKDHRREVDELMNQIAEDKVGRKNKEQGRMKAAVQSMIEELEDERRLRRRSENLHRKLGKELSETKSALTKAIKALENERKSSGLLEDLCDEFARGIGQYDKELRELKKKYTKDCEHKADGLLLYISQVYLGERLQMKMAESCSEKVKNVTMVNRLEEEIISFLGARRVGNVKKESEEQQHHHNLRRLSLESLHLNGTVSAPHDVEDDDSIASDLHCFELNMENTKDAAPGDESARKLSSGRKTTGYQKSIKGLERQSAGLDLDSDDCGGVAEADKGEVSNSADGDERNVDVINGSNLLTHYMDKNHLENSGGCKVHHANYRGEVSRNKLSGRGHFRPNFGDDIEGNFVAASSPVQQWNHRRVSADLEASECSSKMPQGVKDNTLKAKLLEARLEGRHARLKALKGS